MNRVQFLDIIKQKMQSFSIDDLFDVCIFFVSGFIVGLILKYCLRYFLWFLIFGIVSLWLVQNFGIIIINYDYFREFLRLTDNYTISDILNMGFAFAQGHIVESLGFVIGFYLSWEVL